MELLFWTSLGLIFYIYFGYFLLIFLISRFYPEPEFAEMTELPKISMIIAAYNEEKVLEEKIKNCLSLDYPPELLEILIGTDGSNDKTNSILNNCKENNIKVFISNSRKGKNWMMNKLVSESSGDALVISDANIMFDKSALRHLMKPLQHDDIGAVMGKLILLDPGTDRSKTSEQDYWSAETILRSNESRIGNTFGVTGAIYAIRKSLFRDIPTDIPAADDTLIVLNVLKKGYRSIQSENAIGFEYVNDDIFIESRRRIRICAANLNSIRYYASLLLPWKGFVAFGIWSHKILRWLSPIPIITLCTATIFLLEDPMYEKIALFEAAFAGLAVLGLLINHWNIKIKFLTYPLYFFAINFGLLIGIFKFLFGLQKPYWEPTARP